MRRGTAWLVGTGLTLAACGVSLSTPTGMQTTAPIPVSGGVGERLVARERTITVDAATLADAVVDQEAVSQPPPGTWLVIRLTAEATKEAVPAGFAYTQVVVDGRTTVASDRVPSSFTRVTLQAGVPLTGELAFQLPPGTDRGIAEIRFLPLPTAPQLDSITIVRLDLADLPHPPAATVEPPAWSDR